MALIKLGIIAAAISGKVSGNVFAKGKGGAYVRNWSKPTNPRTNAQSAVRVSMTSLASQWRNLTDADRATWNASALLRPVINRMGEQKKLSGFGLFMKQNQFLASSGEPLIASAPVAASIPNYSTVATEWDLGANDDLEITVTEVGSGTIFSSLNQRVVIALTNPYGNGTKATQTKIVGVYNSASTEVNILANVATITIPFADVAAKVAIPKEGQKISGAAKPMNTDDPWDTINEDFPIGFSVV